MVDGIARQLAVAASVQDKSFRRQKIVPIAPQLAVAVYRRNAARRARLLDQSPFSGWWPAVPACAGVSGRFLGGLAIVYFLFFSLL